MEKIHGEKFPQITSTQTMAKLFEDKGLYIMFASTNWSNSRAESWKKWSDMGPLFAWPKIYMVVTLGWFQPEMNEVLVGGFNPYEKYESKWIISPSRDEHKKSLKPPPSKWSDFTLLIVGDFFCPPGRLQQLDQLDDQIFREAHISKISFSRSARIWVNGNFLFHRWDTLVPWSIS